MDLTLVSQWLGHSNISSTLVYAHADTAQPDGLQLPALIEDSKKNGVEVKEVVGDMAYVNDENLVECEKQQIKKMIEKSETARLAFEKKPWIYKAIVRLLKTIQYYLSLMAIHIRMIFDRKYREEVNRAVDGLEEKTLSAIVDLVNEDKKDSRE